jgi:hypothetical protein
LVSGDREHVGHWPWGFGEKTTRWKSPNRGCVVYVVVRDVWWMIGQKGFLWWVWKSVCTFAEKPRVARETLRLPVTLMVFASYYYALVCQASEGPTTWFRKN